MDSISITVTPANSHALSLSLSCSSKENYLTECSQVASSGMTSDGMPALEANRDNEFLPTHIGYEDFVRFCKNPDHRAELWEEIKADQHTRVVLDLLQLFHHQSVHERDTNAHTNRLVFTKARSERLSEELRQYAALRQSSERTGDTHILLGFAAHVSATKAFALDQVGAARDLAHLYDHSH